MKIDDLAYELYKNDIRFKLGYLPKFYFYKSYFLKNIETNKKYYDRAKTIIRKQKLQKLNEI